MLLRSRVIALAGTGERLLPRFILLGLLPRFILLENGSVVSLLGPGIVIFDFTLSYYGSGNLNFPALKSLGM